MNHHQRQLFATIPQFSPSDFSHTLNTPSESPASSVPPITPQLVGTNEQQSHFQWDIKHPYTQQIPPLHHDHPGSSAATPQRLYSMTEYSITIPEPCDHLTVSEAYDEFKVWPMMRGGYSEDGGPGNMVAHLSEGQNHITYIPTDPETIFPGEGPFLLPSECLETPPAAPVASPGVIEAANKRRKTGAKFSCRLCGQTFTATHGLINHKKAHMGIRDFVCEYCHKAFTTKHTCKRHTSTCRSKS